MPQAFWCNCLRINDVKLVLETQVLVLGASRTKNKVLVLVLGISSYSGYHRLAQKSSPAEAVRRSFTHLAPVSVNSRLSTSRQTHQTHFNLTSFSWFYLSTTITQNALAVVGLRSEPLWGSSVLQRPLNQLAWLCKPQESEGNGKEAGRKKMGRENRGSQTGGINGLKRESGIAFFYRNLGKFV